MSTLREEVRLEEVVDGDTIIVLWRGQKEKVRLLLIDTPEMNYAPFGATPEPYARDAKSYIYDELIFANKLEIELDHPLRDQHGRILAHIWINTNRLLNEELLRKGYARYAYDFARHKHKARYRKAEQLAKTEKLRIWSQPNYVKKSGFRSDKRYKTLAEQVPQSRHKYN
ncbi:micrococcal nuclease [Croceifilum oryzae]|uniref:Micrococcal nuclease n=1 Tax=Croceifilum oryzae TaxID=1553429 RepID=A0AAJ1WT58_9BACL|nr:thermonuclease family protein [Croceifilum oryzae]MDQ0417688.1 micrococcal nuclease [Croceifilum oryzae]